MPTYAEYLAMLKSDTLLSDVDSVTERARQTTEQLQEDLAGIQLTDSGNILGLLQAKFREDGFGDAVWDRGYLSFDDLSEEEGIKLMSSVILGDYPKAAFNVQVIYRKGEVSIYYSQVPEGGNPR